MEIADLSADHAMVEQAARMLVDSFAHAWPNMDEALAEVRETLSPAHISRVAIESSGEVLGFIAGRHTYAAVWELHPLVVRRARRGRGIGRALVSDFEDRVRARGGITITLGADDEDGATSLSSVDLYSDLPGHLANFRVVGDHPAPFYRKCGFTITGVVPDANGLGRPDILMSKRVSLR